MPLPPSSGMHRTLTSKIASGLSSKIPSAQACRRMLSGEDGAPRSPRLPRMGFTLPSAPRVSPPGGPGRTAPVSGCRSHVSISPQGRPLPASPWARRPQTRLPGPTRVSPPHPFPVVTPVTSRRPLASWSSGLGCCSWLLGWLTSDGLRGGPHPLLQEARPDCCCSPASRPPTTPRRPPGPRVPVPDDTLPSARPSGPRPRPHRGGRHGVPLRNRAGPPSSAGNQDAPRSLGHCGRPGGSSRA